MDQTKEAQIKALQKSIRDAYYRIGTYIADDSRTKRSDKYVQDQIKKIRDWMDQLDKLLEE